MEFVEGQTLRDLLQELERVPEELCRHIGREVAKGLAAIHEAGGVHRDLKPENVLITEELVVKVMDLGVARLQAEAIRLSQTGAFVGSLEYAAPEQFRSSDGEPDGRADLHALGVVLYELATGQHPYRDEDASRVIGRILNDQPRKAGEVNPFFAFEIIRGLREGQFISQQPDGTWVTTKVIQDIQVPSSVLDLVNARVADLSEEERDLLDVASCCGFTFDPLPVGQVVGVGRIPALKRLAQIERRHRLVRASGSTYVFDHHQVQEALYGSLADPLKQEYHAATADAMAVDAGVADKDPKGLDRALCVDLCDHYLKGAKGEQALRYLDAAFDYLEKAYLNDQAITLADRALDVPDPRPAYSDSAKRRNKSRISGRREPGSSSPSELIALVTLPCSNLKNGWPGTLEFVSCLRSS